MQLDTLFHPRSIAIVGVSREKRKVGHLVAKNLTNQGYKGEVYYVNINGGTILGKKTYVSLSEIGKQIDLVVLAVPAGPALTLLEEIHSLGIKNIVLYAAGFKETSAEGKKMEEVLRKKSESYGINLLGPNCIGYLNTQEGINLTFLKHISPRGNIGIISQSGALGSVVVDYLQAHTNIGLSYFISLGNKTVIDEADSLSFLLESPETNVIGMYIEDVKDGEKFRKVLQKANHKPIIVLKSGSTEAGSKAALSHTGGLVGDDQVFDALFKQYGIIRASNITEFITLLTLFSFGRIPINDKILVLSNAGGVGVLLADELIKQKLTLITISQKVKERVAKAFGESKKITLHNPIDVLGDASAFDYQAVISSMLDEKKIGAIFVLLTPQANTEIKGTAKVVALAQKKFDHPIYPVFMGGLSVESSTRFFETHKMAAFTEYDYLPSALNKILKRHHHVRTERKPAFASYYGLAVLAHEDLIADKLYPVPGKKYLSLLHATEVLHYAGIPVVPIKLVSTVHQAKAFAGRYGYPVVAKTASTEITHKSDEQGVVTGIKTPLELVNAFEKFAAAKKSPGCYLQPTASGYEIFIGAKRDTTFGVVLVLGLGGVLAELLKEVTQLIYPFEKEEFITRINETKLWKYIEGFRGSEPIDPEPLYEVCMRLGALMKRFPQIDSVDINPFFISSSDHEAADARIILNST